MDRIVKLPPPKAEHSKCAGLKVELAAQAGPQIIPIQRFFDGNDDPGSIGCNLLDRPGFEEFRNLLTGLLRRRDVQAVYALIAEPDPGPDFWPFADTVLVVGTIAPDILGVILSPLEPDEIEPYDELSVPPLIKQKHQSPVLSVWWD
jgi:hypothetical protein